MHPKPLMNDVNWKTLETKHITTGEISLLALSSSALPYYYRHKGDYRKAEGYQLSDLHSIPLIQRVRTQLSRGNLDEARSNLYLLSDPSKKAQTEKAETLLENARLEFFEGNWQQCLSEINQSRNHSPSSVTQFTLSQLASICLYELGEFSKSLSEVNRCEAFEKLFPKLKLGFYAKTLKIKIFALTRSIQEAENLFNQLFKELIRENTLDADHLLTLMRVKTDLHTIKREPAIFEPYLCYRLSEIIGDNLYSGLSQIDIAKTHNHTSTEHAISPHLSEYKRVRDLWNDRFGKTTTGKLVATRVPSSKKINLSEYSISNHVFVEQHEALIKLDPFTVYQLNNKPRTQKALVAFRRGSVSHDTFFKLVYQLNLKNSEDFKNTLKVLISRLRKQYDISIRSKNSEFRVDPILIL